jgi:hypothetical protein
MNLIISQPVDSIDWAGDYTQAELIDLVESIDNAMQDKQRDFSARLCKRILRGLTDAEIIQMLNLKP